MVEGKTAGLPQLDPALYPSQIFWLVVSFALLFVLMTYLALPAVRKTQDGRRTVLRTDHDSTVQANEQAWVKREGAQRRIEQARAEARANLDAIIVAAHHEASEQESAMQKRLGDHIAQAEIRISVAREAALRDVPQAAMDLAASILEKLQARAGR